MRRSDIEILRFWKTESLAAVFCIGFNLFDGVVKLKGTSLYIPHCFSPWEVEQYGGGTFQLHQQQCKPWLMLLRVSLITLLEEKDKGEEHLFNRPLPSLSMFLSTSLNLTERLKISQSLRFHLCLLCPYLKVSFFCCYISMLEWPVSVWYGQ